MSIPTDSTLHKKVLVKTYRDFLLKVFDINWPMRAKWDEPRKTDFMLLQSWFTQYHETLLVRFFHDWNTLEALTTVIKYAVFDGLLDHPFVQEAMRLHRALFEELVKNGTQSPS